MSTFGRVNKNDAGLRVAIFGFECAGRYLHFLQRKTDEAQAECAEILIGKAEAVREVSKLTGATTTQVQISAVA